ncbi:MAG: nitroreductase family protein [Candidatus Aminicenantes bacterium]|nr:nitroreductase family protein [Candidatus Aminicenantes bacterium]
MKIIEEIVERRSIREYSTKTVEAEKIARILEAARLAPTARNQQEWKLLLVKNPDIKEQLVEAAAPHQQFLKGAPIIIAACALNPVYVMRCGHPAFLIDLAIVLEHVALQAVREGLGTCWIGSFDENKAKAVLGIPPEVRIVELMSLGYPKKVPLASKRKKIEDLTGWDRW